MESIVKEIILPNLTIIIAVGGFILSICNAIRARIDRSEEAIRRDYYRKIDQVSLHLDKYGELFSLSEMLVVKRFEVVRSESGEIERPEAGKVNWRWVVGPDVTLKSSADFESIINGKLIEISRERRTVHQILELIAPDSELGEELNSLFSTARNCVEFANDHNYQELDGVLSGTYEWCGLLSREIAAYQGKWPENRRRFKKAASGKDKT